jgi:hypothetical protein
MIFDRVKSPSGIGNIVKLKSFQRRRNKDRVESEKINTVNKKLKKGNIVTLMAESVNKLLKADGPF